jgi:hypothetical protein
MLDTETNFAARRFIDGLPPQANLKWVAAGRSRRPRRKGVLESLQAMSLLTIMEIVGPVLLLAVLIYGTLQWSRRTRGPTQSVREASTRQLYRKAAQTEKREEAGLAGKQRSRLTRPPTAGDFEKKGTYGSA